MLVKHYRSGVRRLGRKEGNQGRRTGRRVLGRVGGGCSFLPVLFCREKRPVRPAGKRTKQVWFRENARRQGAREPRRSVLTQDRRATSHCLNRSSPTSDANIDRIRPN